MKLLTATVAALFIATVLPCTADDNGQVIKVADNGSIVRTVECYDGHVMSGSFTIAQTGKEFIRKGSNEFSFLSDGKLYSGKSNWRDIKSSTGGETVISMESEDGGLRVELIYTSYPGLALVRKEICITNTGGKDVRIEGVNVEDIGYAYDCTHTQTYKTYGRFQALGPYRGNWDDPLLVIHSPRDECGLAIGNEAIGIIKRTSVFEDGRSICAGTTMPEQDYPFRRWLTPGQSWKSAPVFIAPYEGRDYRRVVNTTVQDYTRKHMGVRIEQIDRKPGHLQISVSDMM